MTLSEKQATFAHNVAKLIEHMFASGYSVTFGEAYRTPEQAMLDYKHGIGIVKSFHCERLAIDLMLFKDGVFLDKSEDHRPFGEYWKTLNPLNHFGGDFSKPDGNHYEMRES